MQIVFAPTAAIQSCTAFAMMIQDYLARLQVEDRTPTPGVLRLRVLHFPNLVALHAAIFLAPTIVRQLGYPNRRNRTRD
jgi:hypothetical protein